MSIEQRPTAVSGDSVVIDRLLPLYQWLFDEEGAFVTGFKQTLVHARIPQAVDRYLTRALAVGLLFGGVLWIAGTALGYILFATGVIEVGVVFMQSIPDPTLAAILRSLRIPALVLTTGVILGAIGFGLGFGALLARPYLRANERQREINMLLPDAVSFLYALSAGGLNQLEIIEAMAQAEDTYGEVAVEFQSIRKETEYFDTDYRTAIRNQALSTPSDQLSQFLTDMLSIISSGGDMEEFLNDKKETHMRTAKQQQERTLETLELFGEMYMTLSLFPLLLIIVLVIMRMVGEAQPFMLYLTVYGLIPIVGVAFLVLVSTVKQDDPGDGYLDRSDDSTHTEGLLENGLFDQFDGSMFDRIRRRELRHRIWQIVRAPQLFFRAHPLATVAVTAPLAIVFLVVAVTSGAAPTTWQRLVEQSLWGTFLYVYMPVYLVGIPLTVFYEWNVRSRRGITTALSDNLRKLSSANDTGLTLLESFQTVAETSNDKLASEFQTIYNKVNYGMSLRDALVEFNNTYHLPRLARTIKLISEAQEASSQITGVLQTAATASENQDELERQRKSRTRMQVVIIIMTFLTLLAVMAILQSQFLGVMDGLTGGGEELDAADGFGVGNVDTALLSLLFLHAVTLHGALSGLIAGYMRDGKILSGVKYALVLLTIAFGVWVFV